MKTYKLGLYFNKNDKDPLPRSPFFHVYVKTPIIFKYGSDDQEQIFLTPREFHPRQTEVQIDALIKELEDIKKELRRKFTRYRNSQTQRS